MKRKFKVKRKRLSPNIFSNQRFQSNKKRLTKLNLTLGRYILFFNKFICAWICQRSWFVISKIPLETHLSRWWTAMLNFYLFFTLFSYFMKRYGEVLKFGVSVKYGVHRHYLIALFLVVISFVIFWLLFQLVTVSMILGCLLFRWLLSNPPHLFLHLFNEAIFVYLISFVLLLVEFILLESVLRNF